MKFKKSTVSTFKKPLSRRDIKLFHFILNKVKKDGFVDLNEVYKYGLEKKLYKSIEGFRAIMERLRLKGKIYSDGIKVYVNFETTNTINKFLGDKR